MPPSPQRLPWCLTAIQAGFEVKEHFDFMAYGDKLYVGLLLPR